MQSKKSSLKAVLRGGVAVFVALPLLVQSALAGVTSFHGEKLIKSGNVPPLASANSIHLRTSGDSRVMPATH